MHGAFYLVTCAFKVKCYLNKSPLKNTAGDYSCTADAELENVNICESATKQDIPKPRIIILPFPLLCPASADNRKAEGISLTVYLFLPNNM